MAAVQASRQAVTAACIWRVAWYWGGPNKQQAAELLAAKQRKQQECEGATQQCYQWQLQQSTHSSSGGGGLSGSS